MNMRLDHAMPSLSAGAKATMRSFLMIMSCALAVGLAGCSSGEQMKAAEQAVSEFRLLMQGQQFDKIYASGSEDMRKSASEQDMTSILKALNTKLGPVRASEVSTWHINFNTSGSFVTLSYKTEFENGPGVEQFVYQVSKGKAALMSYNVNSAALLKN